MPALLDKNDPRVRLLDPKIFSDTSFQRDLAKRLINERVDIEQKRKGAEEKGRKALAPAADLLDQLGNLSKNINVVEEGPKARLIGSWRKLKSRAGADTDVETYSGITGRIAQLARGLGGEKGVLTDRDIERIMRSIPDPTDKRETAERKLASLRTSLTAAVLAASVIGKEEEGEGEVTGESSLLQVLGGR